MERKNKTKAERRELIFKMNYILLIFLTEKNLLEEFIDNCRPATRYYNFSNDDILTAFVWSESDKFDIWNKANNEYIKYRDKTVMRINKLLRKKIRYGMS